MINDPSEAILAEITRLNSEGKTKEATKMLDAYNNSHGGYAGRTLKEIEADEKDFENLNYCYDGDGNSSVSDDVGVESSR